MRAAEHPWHCLRTQLHPEVLPWRFREGSGEGGLFLTRDKNQPSLADCEFLMDF